MIRRMGVTENEAIKDLDIIRFNPHWNELVKEEYWEELMTIAIQALEEVQAYREIGTPTQIFEKIGGLDVELGKYHSIGTVEEFKALKEKKKIKPLKAYDEERKSNWCSCPNCAKGIGWEYERHFNFCSECGIEFDWE